MAKKRRSRRKRNPRFMAIKVQKQFDIGSLVNGTVTVSALVDLTQDAFIIAADLTWTIFGLDLLDGPVDVGLCHSDYTVTEVKEGLDASPANDSDKIAIERSRRQIRVAGTFKTPENTGSGQVLNDGNKKRTKCGWYVSNSKEVNIFAQNIGTPALTVDTTISVAGVVYVTWQ